MANISYLEMGEGSLFLFQHGLTADAGQIGQLLSLLTGIKVVCMECPGHGKSLFTHDEEVSFDAYADQVVQLLHQLGYDRLFLGGLSMGAGIALNIALRYPTICRGLFLLRPAWLDQSSPKHLRILVEASTYMTSSEGKNQCLTSGLLKNISKELPLAAESILGIFSQEKQAQLPQVIKKMVNDRPIEDLAQLKNINVPCAIIGNDDDPLHPYEVATTLHQHLPESELYKVVSRYTDPTQHQEQVLSLIRDFINKVERT